MARVNVAAENPNRTHEGGMAAAVQSPDLELRRAVLSCLLFENTFYESGSALAARIASLVAVADPVKTAELMVEARTKYGLRHVSLFVARELARRGRLSPAALDSVIQRADELAEFVAIYWKDKRQPLSAAVKKGLARAFPRFSAYQLAKWNRDDKVKLRDVLFLCHAKPKDDEQKATWEKLIAGTLEAPDTWEVALSAGHDKKATWERLLEERKLGALALLRNLRNMAQAGVGMAPVEAALEVANVRGIFPYQFLSAATEAPGAEPMIERAMLRSLAENEKLPGRTVLLLDVSGSMDHVMSAKSKRTRMDAGCSLAVVLAEVCERFRCFTFSSSLVEIPPRRGFALVEAALRSQMHASTMLAQAILEMRRQTHDEFDRLIVVTDEQSHDGNVGPGAEKAYIINVASYQPALDTSGPWTRINGFSDRVADWMLLAERS